MRTGEYMALDALALGGLIASGELKAEEALAAARARAQEINPDINAIVIPTEAAADRALQNLSGGSLLAGVPFLLKDLHLELAGTRLTNGSRLFAESPPSERNSTLTERYLDAGLVIFGKTSSPEFGATVTTEPVLYGPTRNPFDTAHSAGGSSGGAAAAVAAGIVPAAHASDGGGSIRVPASCCGLYGLKPTRGRTPMGPVRGEGWNGQSINHVVSRTVRDSACFLDISCGAEPGDPYAAPDPSGSFLSAVGREPGRLRIAWSVGGPAGAEVEPEVARAVEQAALLCEQLGHHVEEAAPAIDAAACGRAIAVIVHAESLAMLTQIQQQRGKSELPTSDEIEHFTLSRAEWARSLSAQDFIAARLAAQEAGRIMGGFHLKYDLYLCPVIAQQPAPLGWLDMNSEDEKTYVSRLSAYMPFTALFNQTGQPSMSVPLGTGSGGLPIGVMFTGAMGSEEMLLSLAAQLERAAPWSGRYPFRENRSETG